MATTAPFYSSSESMKSMSARRYHDNDACEVGSAIPPEKKRSGKTSGFMDYYYCETCQELTASGK